MFVEDSDYIAIVGEKSLAVLQQSDETNRDSAERFAIEEISGYLRDRFDTDAIFSACGSSRSDLIVMFVCDIALYHLTASQPNRMGYEIRETRYNNCIKRLRDIQCGAFVPDLPRKIAGVKGDDGCSSFGGDKKHRNNW